MSVWSLLTIALAGLVLWVVAAFLTAVIVVRGFRRQGVLSPLEPWTGGDHERGER